MTALEGGVRTTRWLAGSRDERAASAVEVALVFPVFMVFFIAASALLWIVGARALLAEGARSGARFASIPLDPGLCTELPCPDAAWGDYPDEATVAAHVDRETAIFTVTGTEVCYYRGDEPPAEFDDHDDPIDPSDCMDPEAVEGNDKVAVRVTHTIPDVFKPFAGIFQIGDTVSITEGKARAE